MREILFRGKQKDNGKWVYGYLYITHNKEYEIGSYCEEFNIERRTSTVILETVGQYTGLTDKNGKKIFEGDITEVVGEEKEMLTEDQKRIIVKWQDEDCGFNLFCWVNYEVIGNVHDNPEVLKGGEDNA